MKCCLFCLAPLSVVLCGGCKGSSEAPPAPPPPATETGFPTQAQAKLQTLKLWLGAEELTAEVAYTPQQMATGMMFRTNMAENAAMLFAFAMPHRASFWMKNTVLPLSAAYIDADGAILELHDLQPLNTNSVTAASARIQYVLETNQGWFKRHNIGLGTVIRTERGSMHETFFPPKTRR